jgi:hypothetical protein
VAGPPLGPKEYDLVSLLRNSYFELKLGVVEAIVEVLPGLTIQPKFKDAARFVYLDRVSGNTGYRKFRGRVFSGRN